MCQSGYPLRLSKRLTGNLLHGPNHRLSLSFQADLSFLDPFQNVIITFCFVLFLSFSELCFSHCFSDV